MSALKINIVLGSFNWWLLCLSRRSSYLLWRSQEYRFDLACLLCERSIYTEGTLEKVIRKKIQKNNCLRFTELVEFALSYFSLIFFTMKWLRWDGSFTVTLAPFGRISYPESLPCSVSASNNCVILKACNRNITGKATSAYNEKKVTVGLNFCSLEFNHINRTYYKFCISLLGLSL